MLLTIKTDSPEASIGLLRDGKTIARYSWQAGRKLSNQLLMEIERLLKSAEGSPKDITGIIAFVGPGSFTGLRIGLTIANTMAYSLQIPIAGAIGENWQADGIRRLDSAKPGIFVVPYYGREANITQPKS